MSLGWILSEISLNPQALLLGTRLYVYFYIILKVGRWPGWGLLTYSLVCTEVGMCRQVPLCKALQWGTSFSFINKLTNQVNEIWSMLHPSTLDRWPLTDLSILTSIINPATDSTTAPVYVPLMSCIVYLLFSLFFYLFPLLTFHITLSLSITSSE